MNSILAALVGGIGSGATSYGQSRIREQEIQNQQAQRMAELEQQERTRLALAREAQGARQQEIADRRRSVGNSLRAFGINLPEDQLDIAPEALPTLLQQKRAEADAAKLLERDRLAREERLRMNRANYNAGIQAGRIPKSVQYNDDVNFIEMVKDGRIEDGQSAARALKVLASNLRPDPKGNDGGRQAFITKRVGELQDRQPGLASGKFDPGLDFNSALRKAREEADALFGGGGGPAAAPRPAAPAAAPAGRNLLGGLGIGGGSNPPLTNEDRARAAADPAFKQFLISRGYQL